MADGKRNIDDLIQVFPKTIPLEGDMSNAVTDMMAVNIYDRAEEKVSVLVVAWHLGFKKMSGETRTSGTQRHEGQKSWGTRQKDENDTTLLKTTQLSLLIGTRAGDI